MSSELWPEERIFNRLNELSGGSDNAAVVVVAAGRVIREMHDEYEQRIAELEAELEKVKKEAVYWEEAFYEN